jgi:uncharacterized protein (TIGR03437 family)
MADVEANLLTASYFTEGSELDSLQVVSESEFADKAFAPEQPISIFGANLATGIESASGLESLTGTRVTVIDISGNQRVALMLYASPDRINCRVPARTIEGTATVIVTNSNGDSFRTMIEITRR